MAITVKQTILFTLQISIVFLSLFYALKFQYDAKVSRNYLVLSGGSTVEHNSYLTQMAVGDLYRAEGYYFDVTKQQLNVSYLNAYDSMFFYSHNYDYNKKHAMELLEGFLKQPPQPHSQGETFRDDENWKGGGLVIAAVDALVEGSQGFLGELFEDPKSSFLPCTSGKLIENKEMKLGNIFKKHPLFEGLKSFDGGKKSYHLDLKANPNAKVLAEWEDKTPFAIEGIFNGRKIIVLNIYPLSSNEDQDFWNEDSDGFLLMANALKYVSREKKNDNPKSFFEKILKDTNKILQPYYQLADILYAQLQAYFSNIHF
ncbi:hypothetical protein M0813_04619 [Anaeramoeba flamelloides]|uniref:Uncharacterized protein n=1 Tax=Anaeramoeba flamelloides TaxID=1746091 RepID=A0ABQ8XJI8_9EUKA|nr:hypothetical protein M0813_04619 [Anaeramoeba flamelloides]